MTQQDKMYTSDHEAWESEPRHIRRIPPWIKVKVSESRDYLRVQSLVSEHALHTVCKEAGCPNMSECWSQGTATFLIMGDTCTRSCRFCNIKTSQPSPLDWDEPERVAQSVRALNLRHVVITSVNRDERPDGGAPIFAMVIHRIRELQPGCTIEVLIPDFKGDATALGIVMEGHPEVLNHNVETVPRLFRSIQPQSRYEWSLATLGNAKKMDSMALTKSGIMVGLGETLDEVVAVMRDLVSIGVNIVTIGQYLQPSPKHHPVERYYLPEEFRHLKEIGLEIGFEWVESSPLVRSSYHAAEQVHELLKLNCPVRAENRDGRND